MFVTCYFVVVVMSIVLFFGVGDMRHLADAKFCYFNDPYRLECIRTHIYIRDFTLLFFIVINSAWVVRRLLIDYPRRNRRSKHGKIQINK
jgi:hypothetical protein